MDHARPYKTQRPSQEQEQDAPQEAMVTGQLYNFLNAFIMIVSRAPGLQLCFLSMFMHRGCWEYNMGMFVILNLNTN